MNRIGGLQVFQVLRYAALLAIGILFAKSEMDTVSIGVYEALMLLSGFTGFFWTGGMMNALIPLYQRADPAGKSALLSGAFRSGLAINSLLTLLLVLLPQSWAAMLGLGQIPPGVWSLFCAFVFLNNPAYLVEYIYLLRDQPKQMIIYGLLIFSLQVLAAGLPPLLGYDLRASLTGLVLITGLRWLWLLRLLGPDLLRKPPRAVWTEHLRLALPLGGSLLLGGAAAYLDGFIVGNALGQEALAIYRYGARELPLVLLLANAFSTAAGADVAADLNTSLAMIRKRSTAMLHWFTPLSVLLLFSSAWWFPIVFREEFAASHTVFNIYLLLLIPRMLFPQTILTGLGKTPVLFWISAVEIGLNVGLSLALVGPFGMAGVALATVVAHLADKILLIIYNARVAGIPLSTYLNWPVYLAYSLILVLCFVLAP